MEKDMNFLLFNKIRQVGRLLRAGCMPGKIAPKDGACKTKSPAFKRELILVVLSEKGVDLNQKELADKVRVSASTLSEMLNRLEADDYIVRHTNPKDRRAAILTLTDRGEKRAKEIKEEGKRHFAYLFRNLDDSEKRQLISLLDKIISEEDVQ